MFNNFNIKKFAAITAIIMVASFALSALIFFSTGGVKAVQNVSSSNGSKHNINIEKVFDSSKINHISVDTSSTDICFIPEERKDIKVHFTGYTNSKVPILTAEISGDSLDINARIENNNKGIILGFSITNLKINIYLPEDYIKDITIKTSSGDVKMGKLNVDSFAYNASSGDLTGEDFASKSSIIETSSGSVKLSGFGGDLELKTSSGDGVIEYSYESANTKVNTSSGDITLKNLTGDLNTRAQSGDIRIEYEKFNNKANLRSSSGDIDLILPSDSQFGIRVNTSSGSIRTDFSVAHSGKIDEDNLEGTVGSSNNQIIIETKSGDVSVGKP